MIEFDRPVAEVFGYLTDPRRRPEWQSSLRRVADVHGRGEAGTTWRDVTVTGAQPRMRVTEHETDVHWTEVGEWHGVEATLTLGFTPHGAGTRVHATFDLSTRRRVLRPLVAVLDRLAPVAVRSDLARAARLLSRG